MSLSDSAAPKVRTPAHGTATVTDYFTWFQLTCFKENYRQHNTYAVMLIRSVLRPHKDIGKKSPPLDHENQYLTKASIGQHSATYTNISYQANKTL